MTTERTDGALPEVDDGRDLRLVGRAEFDALRRDVEVLREQLKLLHPDRLENIEWSEHRACCNVDRRHLAGRAVAALRANPEASVSEIAATLGVNAESLEHPDVMGALRDAVSADNRHGDTNN